MHSSEVDVRGPRPDPLIFQFGHRKSEAGDANADDRYLGVLDVMLACQLFVNCCRALQRSVNVFLSVSLDVCIAHRILLISKFNNFCVRHLRTNLPERTKINAQVFREEPGKHQI